MKCRVIRSYKSEQQEALIADKGEKLGFERRPTEWSGWLWCTASTGVSAWVPERWVKIIGDACVLTRGYDSTELSVGADEILDVELEESGWVWARKASGNRGWVPADHIRPVRGKTV